MGKGDLLRNLPYTEATATLEVLDYHGVTREDLVRLRSDQQLAESVAGLLRRVIQPPGQFADEEFKSSYGYPEAYKGAKGIAEQTNILRQLLPELVTADEQIANKPLPDGAKGWFAIPRWERLGESYGEALERVLAAIGSTRKFYNYRKGKLGAEYLRQTALTKEMFQKLSDEQKGYDILVVPCQFSLRHRGRSVRGAREVFVPGEFGLGAFAVGCMLLTHPEREVQWEQLHVDCPGDEFQFGVAGGFNYALYFCFSDGRLHLYGHWVAYPYGYFGSASAFVR